MPQSSEFRFALEIRSADDRVLTQRVVAPDWEPACEWAQFAAWRRAGAVVDLPLEDAVITPITHPGKGLPFTKGFRVTLTSPEGANSASDFGLHYFGGHVPALTSELIEQKRLQAGDRIRYRLLAFAHESATALSGAAEGLQPGFAVTAEAPRLTLRPTDFTALRVDAHFHGEAAAGDFPVFIPQHVLAQTAARAAAAGAVETGGVLIGHLARDSNGAELGVFVTAQVPARLAEGDTNKLVFTAETWTAVQAAIALRRSDEIYLGWWHSHPGSKYWCRPECPPERRRTCPFATDFFSEDDRSFHRTVFSKAFHIALVATNTDDGLRHALFGWRDGLVRQRGFHVPADPAASTQPENSHATIHR